MGSILKIENLKYKEILKDITFSLEEKSFNILIGPNGSGKTTLVNCIRGLIDYEGDIIIFNKDIKQKKNLSLYKEIGFFIDEEILLENTTYEELLSLLKNLNYDEESAKKRIFNITKKLDITDTYIYNPTDIAIYAIVNGAEIVIAPNSYAEI